MNVDTLQEAINNLSHQALQKISLDQFEEGLVLLARRQEVIIELVAFYPRKIDKKTLTKNLMIIKNGDHIMMETLNDERNRMKNTFINFGNIRHYFNV